MCRSFVDRFTAGFAVVEVAAVVVAVVAEVVAVVVMVVGVATKFLFFLEESLRGVDLVAMAREASTEEDDEEEEEEGGGGGAETERPAWMEMEAMKGADLVVVVPSKEGTTS